MQNLTFHNEYTAELSKYAELSKWGKIKQGNHVLVFPHGDVDAPLEVQESNGEYSIEIDRDIYTTKSIEVLYRICEIYYDTESVIEVRDYLTKTIDK